jgi:hypothetical protein
MDETVEMKLRVPRSFRAKIRAVKQAADVPTYADVIVPLASDENLREIVENGE